MGPQTGVPLHPGACICVYLLGSRQAVQAAGSGRAAAGFQQGMCSPIPTSLVVFAAFPQRRLSPARGFPLEREHLSRLHTYGDSLGITLRASLNTQKPEGKY